MTRPIDNLQELGAARAGEILAELENLRKENQALKLVIGQKWAKGEIDMRLDGITTHNIGGSS